MNTPLDGIRAALRVPSGRRVPTSSSRQAPTGSGPSSSPSSRWWSRQSRRLVVGAALATAIAIVVSAAGEGGHCDLSRTHPRLTCIRGDEVLYRMDLAGPEQRVTVRLEDANPYGAHVLAMFWPSSVPDGARLYWNPNVWIWVDRHDTRIVHDAMRWDAPYEIATKSDGTVAGMPATFYDLRPVNALAYRILAFNAGGHGYEVTVAGGHALTADAVASRLTRTFDPG